MSKLTFIGMFILGNITGIFGVYLLSKHLTGMTNEELSRAGGMLIDGGHNRDSVLSLHNTDGVIETLTLTQK